MTLQLIQLDEAIATFLDQPHLKAGTRKAYIQALHPMRDYIGPSRPLSDVEPLELQRFWNILTHPSKEYAPSTMRKHYRSLKTFWNWSVGMQLLDRSPFAGIKQPYVPEYDTRTKAMTDDEYTAILNIVRYTSRRDYALIIFIGDTGCRAIGASRLKMSDVNIANCSATITGKGDKVRTVYFGERCVFALKDWIKHKPRDSGEYLFRERFGVLDAVDKPMSPDHISTIIRNATQKAGLERSLGSHSLRHRKGHQLADSGTAITVSAKILGHARTSTTQIYYPKDEARARQKASQLATGANAPLLKKALAKLANWVSRIADT